MYKMSASINKVKTLKSEKLAFSDWVFKWASNINCTSENVNVDIPQIAALLQTFGFKLESIDQPEKQQSTNETLQMNIELNCNKSGIKAVLSKRMDTCICPNSDKTNEGILWVFSGTGPSTSQDNLNKIDESHSNLIPALSKQKSIMIKDIITKVFDIISQTETETETDVNQNKQTANSNIKHCWGTRSYSDLGNGKPRVERSDTWEVDPKTSPPIGASSPLPVQIPIPEQINRDKEHLLAEILHNVKENLEKALVLLPQNNDTFTKTNVKRVSNIKVSPTITTPTRSTTGKSTPDLPKRNTPKKKTQDDDDNTPKTSFIGKRQLLNVASKIGSFRSKHTLPVPAPSAKSKLIKAESMINLNKKSAEKSLEPKLTPRSKCSSLKGSHINLSTTPTSSAAAATTTRHLKLKPTSNIPAPNKTKSNAIAAIKKF